MLSILTFLHLNNIDDLRDQDEEDEVVIIQAEPVLGEVLEVVVE